MWNRISKCFKVRVQLVFKPSLRKICKYKFKNRLELFLIQSHLNTDQIQQFDPSSGYTNYELH